MLPKRKKIISTVFLFLLFLSCTKKSAYDVPEDKIVARVGDRYITAEEFRHSFEFSLATLRAGANPRRTYLDYMIKELLLAQEGYRRGLHKSRYVQSRMQRRRYDNLLEAFILKHVHGKVNLSEEEIREATQKSTVKWRMLLWPTPSLQEAQKAYVQAAKASLEEYVEDQLAMQEYQRTNKQNYETDWIDFLDMPPEILDKVVDLEMGVPSEPFPYGDGYAIAQVLDIHRESITEQELQYGVRRQKIKERLHNIAANRIVHALMDSILTPLDVRVRGAVVEDLTGPLYEWFQDGLPEKKSLFDVLATRADTSQPYLEQINQLCDKELISFKGGTKTIKDFLEYVDYYRSVFNQSTSIEDFQSRVITEIGRMIKNDKFIESAEQEGFADSTNIKEDLRRWEQKWTFEVYRNQAVRHLEVTEDEMLDFFSTRWHELGIADVDTARFYKYKDAVHNALLHEKQTALLESELSELQKRYPVRINEDVLASIELVDGQLADRTSYFIRKNFNFQAVSPTVDMRWVNF
ncbi:hypothetical protein EH223_10245 [candidate division KSB1 bacterium]|nr:hypothetical protein [candidate division KSB1 bacterium]RQW03324.1 MAG: hypothetical protein EH223_10245 [candidate division KSB1 bacterium]